MISLKEMISIKLKLIVSSQFIERTEKIVEVKQTITKKEIKKLFPLVLGVKYNHFCSYEIIDEE